MRNHGHVHNVRMGLHGMKAVCLHRPSHAERLRGSDDAFLEAFIAFGVCAAEAPAADASAPAAAAPAKAKVKKAHKKHAKKAAKKAAPAADASAAQ